MRPSEDFGERYVRDATRVVNPFPEENKRHKLHVISRRHIHTTNLEDFKRD